MYILYTQLTETKHTFTKRKYGISQTVATKANKAQHIRAMLTNQQKHAPPPQEGHLIVINT